LQFVIAGKIHEYKPFGEIFTERIYDPNSETPNFFYTGKRLDRETGLYYYGARYYDPVLGKFITPDTIVPNPNNPQDLNRYSYCSNNPINYTDPTGHNWFKKNWRTIVSVVCTVVSIVCPPLSLAMYLINTAISAYTAIQTGNAWGFVGGLVGGAVFGAVGKELALGLAGAMGNSAFSFAGGAVIGAVEFGISGFGSGFGAAVASGASFSDSLKAGGMGVAIGAATGAVIQGSYMAGWQDKMHGLSRREIYEDGIRRIHALNANKADRIPVAVGDRPLGEPPGGAGRHRFMRWNGGGFDMGPNAENGGIQINEPRSVATTNDYLSSCSQNVNAEIMQLSSSGLNQAISYYDAAWSGQSYHFYSCNSNYAVNTIVYGAGGNSPNTLSGLASPGFPNSVN
jgi:RHS repeat-associated protein